MPTADTNGTQLETECDAFESAFKQAPRRDTQEKLADVQAQFSQAALKKEDFALIGTLGESLEALQLEAARPALSEEAYTVMLEKHTSLVQRVTAKCTELTLSKQFALVKRLGTKLNALKSLDFAALAQECDSDPVYVDPPVLASKD